MQHISEIFLTESEHFDPEILMTRPGALIPVKKADTLTPTVKAYSEFVQALCRELRDNPEGFLMTREKFDQLFKKGN